MDPYKVLGLNHNATKEQIKQAYRKLVLNLHPDKHSHSPKIVKDNALLRFKQVCEAHDLLIDDIKRANYYNNNRATSSTNGGVYGYGSYYNNASSRTSYYSYRPPHSSTKWRFDLNNTFHFLTSRSFLLNLAFASALLGGAAIIETIGETLWKMHNTGKSFEEAVNSIEDGKRKKDVN